VKSLPREVSCLSTLLVITYHSVNLRPAMGEAGLPRSQSGRCDIKKTKEKSANPALVMPLVLLIQFTRKAFSVTGHGIEKSHGVPAHLSCSKLGVALNRLTLLCLVFLEDSKSGEGGRAYYGWSSFCHELSFDTANLSCLIVILSPHLHFNNDYACRI
jgi:hypothetical protein